MEIQWPLILFTFFNCLAGGIFLMQGILTLAGKGKAMQLASCVSAIVALAIGGLSVFFHLQHPLRMLNGFGHITSGITIELIFVIVFAIAVVLYFLMMRRSEEGVAPKWCAILAIVVSLALPFATGDSYLMSAIAIAVVLYFLMMRRSEEGVAPKWCAILAIVVSLALPFATGDSYLMSAIPAWDTMLLPLYYVVATVMLGGLAAMIIAGATKAADAVKLSATVAFIGAVVCAIVSIIYAAAISGMGSHYTEMQYYGATKAADAVKLSATVAFIGAVVCAIVSIIYAAAISGMGSHYTEMQYYFDPTLPDVAMRQSEQITGAILAGEHAVAFWLGNVAIGCAVPAVLAALVMTGKIPAEKALAVAVVALVCAVIGTVVWRVLLYEVAVNALIQFQWAL